MSDGRCCGSGLVCLLFTSSIICGSPFRLAFVSGESRGMLCSDAESLLFALSATGFPVTISA